MTIPIPDGIRRIIGETFKEDQDRRDREEADAWLQRLKDTPMAKLGPDEPLNISTERPKWMRKGGYDTPDFTSTAQPALVPEEGDALFGQFEADREYSSLGPSPELSPVDIAGDPVPDGVMQDGRGGPENGPLSEATITDIRKAREARQSGALRQALMQQPGTPDDAAKDFDLAEQMGVNRGEVASNRKSYEFAKTARDIDALKVTAPRLRTWLDDARENLEFAHDDIDNLGWWEQAGQLLNPGSLSFEEVGSALSTGAIEGGQQQFFGAIEQGTGIARMFEWIPGVKKLLDAGDQGAREMRQAAALRAATKMPQGDTVLERGIYSAFQSAPASLEALALTLITKSPTVGAASMGVGTAGQAYGDAEDAGKPFWDRFRYAMEQGSIETATELLPLKFLIGDLAKDAPLGRIFFHNALSEGIGEQAATFLQDASTWLELHPEKTLGEFMAERPNAAMETLVASTLMTGMQTTLAAGVQKTGVMLDEQAQQKRSEDLAKTFETMAGGAKASKLLTRLPQKYRDFVNTVTKDGPLESVRVQPEAFEELAQSAGVSTEALAQAFRIDPADINSALSSGEDVVIPSGNYAAALQTAKKEIGVSGETIHAALAPNMRLRAEDFTAKEREAMKAVYEEERAATEQANSDTTFADAADRVREAVRTQLAEAKIFNNETASTQAQIASEMIITLAERTGQDPEALWNDLGFKVTAQVGEDVNELSQSQTRPAEPVSDEELTGASEALQPREFEAWKLGREGRSAEDIAVAIGGENAEVSPQTVLAWQTAARRKGFALARIHEPTNPKGRPQTPETQRVIEMLAAGKSRDEIISEVYPDRDAGKARNLVRQLAHKHKDAIEAKRAPVMELAQSASHTAEQLRALILDSGKAANVRIRAAELLVPTLNKAGLQGLASALGMNVKSTTTGESARTAIFGTLSQVMRDAVTAVHIYAGEVPYNGQVTPAQREAKRVKAAEYFMLVDAEGRATPDPQLIEQEFGGTLAQEKRGGFTGINLSQDPVIRLYESANLSTFSHEAAHWYLTTLEKLARGTAVGRTMEGGELGQSRAVDQPNDDEISRAAQALQPKVFEIWKLSRMGDGGQALSNKQIADIMSERGDTTSDIAVAVALNKARKAGFVAATARPGTDTFDTTMKVLALKAKGLANRQIAERVFPDRELDKALSNVKSLISRNKDRIAQLMSGAELAQGEDTNIAGQFPMSVEERNFVLQFGEETDIAAATPQASSTAHTFIIAQLAAIKEWAGKSAEFQIYDDSGQITPEGIELQEAFSESFEAYLREGKAPSTALRQVFATMKAWLLRTYKQVRDRFFQRDAKGNWVSALGRVRVTEADGFQISQEIRDVFDRMLATEEAIAAARTGMEQDADRMAKALLDKGVITEKAYARTRERLQAAREKAEADLMARLMEEYERSQKSWYRDEERQVRRDVTSEIDERPEQRAFAWLSGKGWRDTQADHVERAAEAEIMQAVDEGLFETDANDDTLKLLQQRAIERGLGPLILMFRTTSGRIIAFPGENGAVYHDLARNLFGLGDLKLEHGMYNPRKWPTLAEMDAAGERAWYATTGEHADTEVRELAQRTYQHDKHREQVKTAYDYLRDNPEAVSGPLSKIMAAVDVSAYAADRARRLIRKGELAQLDGPVIVYRGSEENGVSSAGVGRLGTGVYLAEDPEIGGEWGGQTGKVDAYRINGRLFDLDETTAEGLENYEKQEDTEAAKKLFTRLRSEGYVGVRDPWSGHINVFTEGAMERYPEGDVELGATWTNELELGQSKSSLDMSEAARMQRAREQGFDVDTPLYHGTPDSRGVWTDGFKTPKEKFGEADPERVYFFAEDQKTASTYADDKRAWDYQNATAETIPVYLRMKNPATVEWNGRPFRGREKDGSGYAIRDYIDKARADGHDGIIIHNVIDTYDGKGKPTTIRAVFDPSNIRSTNAAFDPSQSGSSKLLAQTGGNARTTPPASLPPMRLDLSAVREQYGDEAVEAIPPEVRAYSAQATDVDQFLDIARDVRKTLGKKHPKSLWKFLSSRRRIGKGNDRIAYSGIRDDGGEIIKIIGEKKAAPGLISDKEDGKRVRAYTIHDAAIAAWEEGYTAAVLDDAAFLDALRADFDGTAKLYAQDDIELVQEIANAEQWAAWFDQNGIDINEKDRAVLRAKLEEVLTSTAENAIGPDEAAALLGGVLKTKALPDGKALLDALKQGPLREKLIREETQRRMIATHGDIFKNGTIAQEAERFARNEIQERQDEIELEALGKAAGRQFEVNLAKSMARENLKTKQVREILNYNQWLTLEGRWNKKAIETATKGDTDKAFDYKRYALINRQMFLEARKLAEKIERDVAFLKSFEKKEKQAKLLKAGQDFLDQMNQLLERVELRKRSPKDLRERQSLAAWFAQKQTEADPLRTTTGMTPEEVMAAQIEEIERSDALAAMQQESQLRNYQSLTFEEFSAVRDQADMIANMARLMGGLLEDGERRSLQLAVDDIVARIIAAKPKALPPESYASFAPKETGKRGRREYLAELRTMQALVRMIDGMDNGPLAKNTLQKLNPAYSRRIARTREEEGKIVALYKAAYGSKLADLRKDPMRFAGVPVALSKLERISVALNMGTEINRKRLMDGYGWDASTLQAIINTLDQNDWRFVESVWTYVNSLYPEANAAHQAVHGVPLSKQPGIPVVTKYGVIEGQYFPLKYNPHQSSRAAQQALDAEAKQVAGRVGTRKASGYTKERVKGRVTLPVLLDFSVVLPQHVDEVVASITTQKAMLDVGRIIVHKDVEQAIVERHGRIVYKQLLSSLREARNGQETARLSAERALVRLRNGATIVGLGWNLKTAILQLGGHTNSIVRLGGPNLGAIGGLPWLLKGIYRLGIGAEGMQNGLKFIVERSEYMRNRRESQNREMADLRRKLEGGSVKGAAQSFIEQSSMFLIVRAQYYLVDAPLFLGAYEKAIANGASEADAVASADQTVIDAQGGGEVYQLAGIQRGSPLLKLFTNFASYSVTTWNLNVNRTRATNFRNPGQAAAWALDMAILNWAPVMLTILAGSLIATGGGDGEDDLQEQMVRQQLSFLMSQLGLFGQLGSAINEFSYSGPQGTRAFSDASKAVQAAGKDVERLLAGEQMTGDVIRPLNLALGAWWHYPAGALDRFVRGAWALAEGETEDPKALVSGPPRN